MLNPPKKLKLWYIVDVNIVSDATDDSSKKHPEEEKKSKPRNYNVVYIWIGISVLVAGMVIGSVQLTPLGGNSLEESGWAMAGPISINKVTYKLGETIFITVHGIPEDVSGYIVFAQPNGEFHHRILLDGAKSSFTKQYFTPSLSGNACNVDELTGVWTVLAQDINDPSITEPVFNFNILNQIIPGAEDSFENQC